MTEERNAIEATEARLVTLEIQTEWLAIELANIRSILVSVATVASEALLPDN